MPNEDFSALSPKARQICSKIPNDIKAVTFLGRNVNSNDGVNEHNTFFIKP